MSNTVPIELSLAERHVLTHLLETSIRKRVEEAVTYARYSTDLEEAGARVRRLAQLQALAWNDGSLPRDDLDAHRGDLETWALETEATTEENDAAVAEAEDEPGLSTEQRRERVENPRGFVLIDYAHRCVCERIVAQIDAAREAVTA